MNSNISIRHIDISDKPNKEVQIWKDQIFRRGNNSNCYIVDDRDYLFVKNILSTYAKKVGIDKNEFGTFQMTVNSNLMSKQYLFQGDIAYLVFIEIIEKLRLRNMNKELRIEFDTILRRIALHS